MWVTNMDQYSSQGIKYALATCINSIHSHNLTKLTYLVVYIAYIITSCMSLIQNIIGKPTLHPLKMWVTDMNQ